MIRPILTEIVLFLTPFVLYAVFLWATRAGVFHPDSWSWKVIAWLTMAALATVIISFVVMAQFAGQPPHSPYVPAQLEDGKLVPGHR
jgi:Family of unknown function (DUF6111)